MNHIINPIAATAVICLALLACTEGGEDSTGWSREFGELVVHNDTSCSLPCSLEFREVARYGSEEDAILLQKLPRAIRMPSGSVVAYVQDAVDHPVLNYHGNSVRSVGGTGSGPGEFHVVHAVASTGDSVILLHDGNRVTVFNGTGGVVHSRQMDLAIEGDGVALSDGELAVVGQKQQMLSRTQIHRVAQNGRSVHSSRVEPVTSSVGAWRIAVGRDKTLWVSEDAGNYRIQQFSAEGTLLRTIVRATPHDWYVFAHRNRASLDSAVSRGRSRDITAERMSRPQSWFPASKFGGIYDDGVNLWVAFNVAIEGWEKVRPAYDKYGTVTEETLSHLYRTVVEVIDREDGTLRGRGELPGIGQLLNDGSLLISGFNESGIIQLKAFAVAIRRADQSGRDQ